jgi:hypothetical protein
MAGVMLRRMEALLIEAARNRSPLTYQQLAQLLELKPPHTIHQTTECLEIMMRIHAQAQAPQLASLVVSKSRRGLPAPGFFLLVQELGLYDGSVDGEDAWQFHAQEMQRCFDAL